MSISRKVMQGDISKLCLLVAALAIGSAAGTGECKRGITWWDRQRGSCVPCTLCDHEQRLVVRYPCEIHRDTICQSLYEAQIPPFNTPAPPTRVHLKDNDSSEIPSEYEWYEYVDYDSEVNDSDGGLKWDLQTTSLSIAASGCIVFFVVVLVMSLYHARQWKVIRRVIKSDVQDLTAKLKLMEAGGETTAEPVVAADHHIYCNINVGKQALFGHTKSLVWQDTKIKYNKEAHREGLSTGLKNPSGKGKRLIILHIGSSDGFLDGGDLVFEAKKEEGDYHSEIIIIIRAFIPVASKVFTLEPRVRCILDVANFLGYVF